MNGILPRMTALVERFPVVAPIIALVLISSVARAVYFELFEKHFKLAFADAPTRSFLYFSGWSGIVVLLFPEQAARLFADVTPVGYMALAFVMLAVFPALYHAARSRSGSPEWLASLFPGQGMLTLGEQYILAKIADVVFQQLVAGVLILVLAAGGVPYPTIVIVFVALFAAAHVYIFPTAGAFWGLYYTAYAALGGFAFPFLILFIPGGIAYAIVLHMLFYVISGLFFATLPRPSPAICKEFSGSAPV